MEQGDPSTVGTYYGLMDLILDNIVTWLVVSNRTIFHFIYGRMSSFPTHIFQRGRSTTNQLVTLNLFKSEVCNNSPTGCIFPGKME